MVLPNNLFSENTNTIAQHGRRGANMQTLVVMILKNLSIKTGDINMVKYSNISVLTHKFMDAVKKDTDFDLIFDGQVYETIKATSSGTK